MAIATLQGLLAIRVQRWPANVPGAPPVKVPVTGPVPAAGEPDLATVPIQVPAGLRPRSQPRQRPTPQPMPRSAGELPTAPFPAVGAGSPEHDGVPIGQPVGPRATVNGPGFVATPIQPDQPVVARRGVV